MFFKVLCVALLACTLIQAEHPKPIVKRFAEWFQWLGDSAVNMFSGLNGGLHEGFHNLVDIFQPNYHALINASHETWEAIIYGTKAKVIIGKTFPRFFWKLWQQRTNQTEGTFLDKIGNAFKNVSDENSKVFNKSVDHKVTATKAMFNVTTQLWNSTVTAGMKFPEFVVKVIGDVMNRSDLSEAEKTGSKVAMKEATALFEEVAEVSKSKFTGKRLEYHKQKITRSNIAGSKK